MSDLEIAVQVQGLRKEYANLVAVDGLDLVIPKGCIYGLIGPNGSGKTTTIKVIMGLLHATAGKAILLGEPVGTRTKHPLVSYMPQDQAIYTDLTVRENLDLFASLYEIPLEKRAERIHQLLSMVDLTDREHSLVSNLSGGMRHRLSLACALVNDPELVFLDEPTVGVDPELRAVFWHYFHQLKASGRTIVLTTHYMDEARRCDIVAMIHRGKIIAQGAPEELIRNAEKTNLEDTFLEFLRRGGH